jgi:branched-chain amino acid transport system permease protein
MTVPSASVLLNALVDGVLLGGLFAVTALGLSLVFGVMRLINIVHGELLVLGAYLALWTTRHTGLDPLLSLLVVAPVLFLVVAPVYRYLLEPLRDKGPEPAMLTTFGLSVIAQSVFILVWSGDTQSLPASYV